jgi:hypothetical protein
MALTDEQREVLMDIVRDPRYTQEKYMQGLPLSAALKEAVLVNKLVEKLNRAYGWDWPEDMMYKNLLQNSRNMDNIIYEIVLKPGYTLEKFLKAIESGYRL